MHPALPAPLLVLVTTAASRLLAIPAAAALSISSPLRTPPPPAAAPWLAGFVWLARPGLLLAPFGPSSSGPGAAVALAPADTALPLAVAIDAPGGLAQATPLPAAGRLSAACPASWLSSCRLADGREAALLDPAAVAASAGSAA